MREEVKNWLEQGLDDFESAKENLEIDNFYLVAFLCQQASEKVLKALYISDQKDLIKSHNLLDIIEPLEVPEDVKESCVELNRDYIDSRYPDAAVGTPSENYTEKKAETKLEAAEAILEWTKKQLER